jgi:outer membrane immunogenic protein
MESVMRNLSVVALVAFVAAVSPALAADLPQAAPPPPRAPATYVPTTAPIFNWTGVYIGLNGGYGWNSWEDGSGDTFKGNGFLGGGEAGFNYQINQFVIGFEGDIDWSGMKWSQTQSANFSGFGNSFTGTLSNKDQWLSTFAARFGVAADRALFYGKAGGAWAQESWDLTVTNSGGSSATGTNTFNRLGWMVGAGLEYAVTENVTLKAEYNYIDFGTDNETLTGGGLTSAGLIVPSKLTMSVVKVGLNVLFH